MKKILISKKTWQDLKSIKDENKIKNMSKTVEFLFNQYEKYSESFEDDDDDLEDNIDLPTPTDHFEGNIGRLIDEVIEKKSRWT